MRIILEGTAEEISDLVYLQSRKYPADKVRTFGEVKHEIRDYIKKCTEADGKCKPKKMFIPFLDGDMFTTRIRKRNQNK